MCNKSTFYFKLHNNRNQINEILNIYSHLLASINFLQLFYRSATLFQTIIIADLITMIDDSDLILGGNMQLYMCNPRKSMTLNGKLENITYTMRIDMSNTEIQAFNIEDGILSSAGKFISFQLNFFLSQDNWCNYFL